MICIIKKCRGIFTRPDNNAFDRELAEMSGVKLPQYRKQIEDAKEKAYEQFRYDFIAKLKSSIDTVKN